MTAGQPFADLAPDRRRLLGWWLAGWAFMVLMTVVIGGVTRLTESGLSITEWAPVSGVIPPIGAEAWDEAFRAYQQIPEYQELNRGMTLSEFKLIFFWEYLHRLWARLVGLVLAVPFVVFLVRRWLPARLARRLAGLLVLTGIQGALGWYMVASGLVDRTDVSQYRLAAHLGLALVIYVITAWTAADLLGADEPSQERPTAALRPWAGLVFGLTFATAIAGAFVAGLDGGRAYNTFPLMGGTFVPGGYFALEPWWRNWFENVAAVQFNHRWIGMLTLLAIVLFWGRARNLPVTGATQWWLHALPVVAMAQVTLGVATLLLVVPVWLAALHQAGAVVLLTAAVLLYRGLRRDG
jgi:cytochrome c oxidase assembly protein subunit 15